jgi:succinate dehydrogenase / fumarate reductase cytochrome b subunit
MRNHNPLCWFDPRGKMAGSWAFLLNRLTALALTFYLGLHLTVLNKLTRGAEAYDDFVVFAQAPLIKAGEVILVAAVLLHGLNGIRVILLTFGIGLRRQKLVFVAVAFATLFLTMLFGTHVFNG